jgi:hypothetical protein
MAGKGGMVPKVLYCIPFHYVPARLRWLRMALRCFADYPCSKSVIVYTNTSNDGELGNIRALLAECQFDSAEIRHARNLGHPFDLTWERNEALQSDFQDGGYSHFIYAEDDLLIPYAAFEYWLHARPQLSRRGLVPGFVRVERRESDGALMATDQFRRAQLDWTRIVRCKPWHFTNIDSAYTGSFVLDRDLAAEYVHSRSSSREASAAVKNWDIRERAAMGLVFESVPRLFWHRLAIPFDGRSLEIPACAYIHHAPANYANDATSQLATLKVNELLIPPSWYNFFRERQRSIARLLAR